MRCSSIASPPSPFPVNLARQGEAGRTGGSRPHRGNAGRQREAGTPEPERRNRLARPHRNAVAFDRLNRLFADFVVTRKVFLRKWVDAGHSSRIAWQRSLKPRTGRAGLVALPPLAFARPGQGARMSGKPV